MFNVSQELVDLKAWASAVQDHFEGALIVQFKKVTVVDNLVVLASYSAESSLPANEVTKVIHTLGLKFARGRRYFFVYDKQKRYLLLLFYPFYQFIERKSNSLVPDFSASP